MTEYIIRLEGYPDSIGQEVVGELVRCKDCKHYKAYEYTGKLACHYVIGGTVVRDLNDFCSRAERITDA